MGKVENLNNNSNELEKPLLKIEPKKKVLEKKQHKELFPQNKSIYFAS